MIVGFIDEHRDVFGVEPICSVLEIAPSTYYSAKRRPASPRAIRDALLKVTILALWKANYEVYGARKLYRAPATGGAHPPPKPVLTEPVADTLSQGVALHLTEVAVSTRGVSPAPARVHADWGRRRPAPSSSSIASGLPEGVSLRTRKRIPCSFYYNVHAARTVYGEPSVVLHQQSITYLECRFIGPHRVRLARLVLQSIRTSRVRGLQEQ